MHVLSALKAWLTIQAVWPTACVHRSALMRGKLHLHWYSSPHRPVRKHQWWAIGIRDCDTQTQRGKPSLVSVDGDSKVLFATSEFVRSNVENSKMANEESWILYVLLSYMKRSFKFWDNMIMTAYLGFDTRFDLSQAALVLLGWRVML